MEFFSQSKASTANIGFEKAIHRLIVREAHVLKAPVCVVCDCFVIGGKCGKMTVSTLKKQSHLLVPSQSVSIALRRYYTAPNAQSLSHLLLSPRAVQVNPGVNDSDFIACVRCEASMKKRELPVFAIANGRTIGEAPQVLSQLNPVELSLISKARTDRHIFQYYAGAHESIRGWHSLYHNDVNQFAAVLNRIEQTHPTPTIATLVLGKFTKQQHKRAKAESEVRRGAVRRALTWLKENNSYYHDVNVDSQLDSNIIVIDKSELCESQNSRIESAYDFTVVFPDSTEPNAVNGGYHNQEEMREDTLKQLLVNSDLSCTLIAKSSNIRLKDYEDGNLQKAFPLQFPFGIGQIVEAHCNNPRKPRQEEYYRWMLSLSLPNMHRGDFVLIVHNIYERYRAVSASWLRARSSLSTTNYGEMFSEMDTDVLQQVASRRQHGTNVSTLPGAAVTTEVAFLQSVNAATKSMAHTAEAAMKTRSEMFAYCTEFGLPAIFFTVTPEDNCNLRINIMRSGGLRRNECDMSKAEPEDILEEFQGCGETRVMFPGLCALDFRQVLQLIVAHVLGWDEVTGTGSHGAFGKLDAYFGAIEEQARKTLHVHFLLWVSDWNALLTDLHSECAHRRESAVASVAKYFENISSCKLHGKVDIAHACFHPCDRNDIQCCSIQDLRNLRNKRGTTSIGKKNIAFCRMCNIVFDSDKVARNVLANKFHFNDDDHVLKERLQLFLMHESSRMEYSELHHRRRERYSFVNTFVRNLHAHVHSSSCWKKSESCRFAMPKLPFSSPTTLDVVADFEVNHTSWTGSAHSRCFYQLKQRRSFADVYVNTFHEATSQTLACNTNVQLGVDGKHIMYCTIYAAKSNQKEDSDKFVNVVTYLANQIKKQDAVSEINQTPFEKGFRRLLSAVLANVSGHVISAPLAAFIVHEGSRFIQSHKTTSLPLPALLRKDYYLRIKTHGTKSYFNNLLFDYQFRNETLDDICLYKFFGTFESAYLGKKGKNKNVLPYLSLHPGKSFNGTRKRIHPSIPILGYSDLVDTAKFKGWDILDPNVSSFVIDPVCCDAMIQYARQVMMIFVPWRESNCFDIDDESILRAFQKACQENQLGSKHSNMLQNIQNCHDSMKNTIPSDPLERCTTDIYQQELEKRNLNRAQLDLHMEEAFAQMAPIISQVLFDDGDAATGMVNQAFTLDNLRRMGGGSVGFDLITQPTLSDQSSSVVSFNCHSETLQHTAPISDLPPCLTVTYERLFSMTFQSSTRNVGETHGDLLSVAANGSFESITEWGMIAFTNKVTNVIDKDQNRAFQVIIASYLFTYLEEADLHLEQFGSTLNRRYIRRHKMVWTKDLLNLRGSGNTCKQLVAFLTGPGGSGKSHVISTVVQYGKAFNLLLGAPFSKRTIVVTATSGVAATAIRGETIHSAALLMTTKQIDIEIIKDWRDARLLILDEISFANKELIAKLDLKLRELKEEPTLRYGGIHIVFAGDFSQLEPVKGEPLYESLECFQWHDWINCYLPLNGNHRFATDPVYGEIMRRFRNGIVTLQDIQTLNTRVVKDSPASSVAADTVPPGISYAVFTNKEKDSINSGIFFQHLQATHSKDANVPCPLHTIMIQASDLVWRRTKKHHTNIPVKMQTEIINECGSNNIETTGFKRNVDPMLKLHLDIPLMYTMNTDVPNGIANGTLCYLQQVVLKATLSDMTLPKCQIDEYWVNLVSANDVDYLLCRHAASKETFQVKMQSKTTAEAKIPLPKIFGIPYGKKESFQSTPITLSQFPVLINYASTVHKLQGQTKSNLCISTWCYAKNWPYVACSRVTAMVGLYLRIPLKEDTSKYNASNKMTTMLKKFAILQPCPIEVSEFVFD